MPTHDTPVVDTCDGRAIGYSEPPWSICRDIMFSRTPVDGGLALIDRGLMGGYFGDNFTLSTEMDVDSVIWLGGYVGQSTTLSSFFSSDFTIDFKRILRDILGDWLNATPQPM